MSISFEHFQTDAHLLGPWHKPQDDSREVFASAKECAAFALWQALVNQKGKVGVVEIVCTDGVKDVRSFLDAYCAQPMIAQVILKTRPEGYDFAGGIRLRLHANPQKKSDALVSLKFDPYGDVDRNEPPNLRDVARGLLFDATEDPKSEAAAIVSEALGEDFAARQDEQRVANMQRGDNQHSKKEDAQNCATSQEEAANPKNPYDEQWELQNMQRKEARALRGDERPRVRLGHSSSKRGVR